MPHHIVRSVTIAAVLGLCTMLLPAMASALPPAGIKGTVTDAETSAAVDGAEVCAYESSVETRVECAKTSAIGEYALEGLTAGSFYKVRFTASHYTTQWYQGAPEWSSATSVEAKTGLTPDINAAMAKIEEGPGFVSGRVTNASNGQGAGGVQACIYASETYCAETNGNGEYRLEGIPVGSYQVNFSPAEACEEEQGEKIRCQPKSNYISEPGSVKVKSGQTAILNEALRVGGQISGTVTNASITHPGLAKIEVCATRVTGPEEFGGGGCAYTSSNGQYTINGLVTGFYKIEFSGEICSIPKKGKRECPEVYITQYYQGQQTFKNGTTVTVTVGSNTSGINESLREAFPTTPAIAAAPTLTGTAAVGQALTCSQGSWAHEPTYLLYQWTRNGTVISGQTGATYTLQAADQGHSITCTVTAGNGAGAASANSNTVAIPVPLSVFAGVKVKGSVASVTLRCPGPGACSGVMRILARVTTRHGRRKKTSSVTIGVASFSMAAGKRVTLRVHLTGPGSQLLRRAGRRGLRVQIAGSGVQAHAAVLRQPSSKRRR
jgi:hypothetical protein